MESEQFAFQVEAETELMNLVAMNDLTSDPHLMSDGFRAA